MVETRAWQTLARFCQSSGQSLSLPVPVERIAEDLYDFGLLWEPIPEPEGRTVLAGLAPQDRVIVFNETRRALFDATPFLYRTVLAHEIGHWELHVDKDTLHHPCLPGFERTLSFVCHSVDDAWEERHAHWFASHLLLPRSLLQDIIPRDHRYSYSEIYALRDQCQVTITMMTIALERIGIAYIDNDGRIHPSKQEALGQTRLF